MQRVDQAGGSDDGGTMLIIVKHRNFHPFAELLFDDETFRRLDILEIDTAKAWFQHGDRLNEFFGVPCVQLEVDTINVGKFLEQDRLALHHRFRGGGTDVAKAKHRGAIRNDGNQIALGGVIISSVGIGLDGEAGRGDPRRIGKRQVVLAHQRLGGRNLEFAGTPVGVEAEGFLVKL